MSLEMLLLPPSVVIMPVQLLLFWALVTTALWLLLPVLATVSRTNVYLLVFQRDVDKRLGCCGGGSDELKDHPFFAGYDWSQVYQQRYTPPLIPPRGEVNAADAFDIGSFDEEDTKGKMFQLLPGESARKPPQQWQCLLIDVQRYNCVGHLGY